MKCTNLLPWRCHVTTSCKLYAWFAFIYLAIHRIHPLRPWLRKITNRTRKSIDDPSWITLDLGPILGSQLQSFSTEIHHPLLLGSSNISLIKTIMLLSPSKIPGLKIIQKVRREDQVIFHDNHTSEVANDVALRCESNSNFVSNWCKTMAAKQHHAAVSAFVSSLENIHPLIPPTPGELKRWNAASKLHL